MKNPLSILHQHLDDTKPPQKHRWCFLAIIVVALSPLVAHAQDYSDFFSDNGSFEFGSSPPPLSFPSSNSTLNTITGWTFYAHGTYPQWFEDGDAQDGARYVMLRSSGGAGADDSGAHLTDYSMNRTPFTVGEVYVLSFWAAGGPAANNQLAVMIDSTQATFSIPTYTQAEFDALLGLNWFYYSHTFTASSKLTDLYVFSPPSTQGGYQSIVFLDNFTLTQVPEPGSAVLAAAGGLVLLGRRKRRRGAGHATPESQKKTRSRRWRSFMAGKDGCGVGRSLGTPRRAAS